jgi:hypothetical protein
MPTGKETFFTEYDGDLLGVRIDHDKHAIGVWKLDGGKWVEGDMDALYEGTKQYDAKPSDYPPLPKDLWGSPPSQHD